MKKNSYHKTPENISFETMHISSECGFVLIKLCAHLCAICHCPDHYCTERESLDVSVLCDVWVTWIFISVWGQPVYLFWRKVVINIMGKGAHAIEKTHIS